MNDSEVLMPSARDDIAMDARIRAFDWTRTPLGPAAAWPAPLRTLTGIMLAAPQPMFVAWGHARTMVYNDAYAALIGRKHPAALGVPFLEVWAEARADLAPLLDRVFAGTPLHMDEIELTLERHGRPEEAHFAFSYTPVLRELGHARPGIVATVDGLFCVCTETTLQVIATRRQAFRQRFEDSVREMTQPRALMAMAARLLGTYLGTDRVGYAEIAPDGVMFTVDTDWCAPGMGSSVGTHRLDDFGPALMGRMRAGHAVAFDDAAGEPLVSGETVQTAYRRMKTRAAITVPLVRDGRFVAVLYVHSAATRSWTDEDVAVVREIAERTWAAVERAKAEEEIRRYRALIEQSSDFIGMADLEGRTLFLNEGGRRMVGAPDDFDWRTAEVLDFFLPEERVPVSSEILPKLIQGRGWTGERRFRHFVTGAPIPVMYDAFPIKDDAGRVTALATVTRDISAQKAAEAALRTLNETLEQRVADRTRERDRVWHNARDLQAIVGADGVFQAVNPAWRAILGYDPAEIAGRSFHDFIWNDDADLTQDALKAAAAAQDLSSFENRYRHRDGSPRWISWNTTTEGGLVFAYGRDVTAAKALAATERVQRRLQHFSVNLGEALRNATDARSLTRASAERLGRYLDAGSVGYAIADAGGDTLGVDSPWARDGFPDISGTHRMEDYGQAIYAVLREGRVARVVDTETDPLTAGPALRAGYAAIGARALLIAPLIRDGRLAGNLFVIHPAPRAWTDEEAALVEQVADRTWASLQRLHAEEALRQSQKMEAVGQLTGGLAHDFNNLLTGITGSLELLGTRVAQGRIGELGRFIAAAQDASKRAAALTHRLLAFSRQQTLDPKPTDINRLIAGMDDLVRRTVGPEVVVDVVAAAGLWATRVDPNQLENALLNLCINARDAMPHGGRLTVETSNLSLDARAAQDRDLPEGQYVSLRVSDNGVGMSAEVIRRAFDPFYTTKPIGLGTGLGLSMVYGFARQSGGQARIFSEPGQGAMVCLYLPRHLGPADLADLPAGSRHVQSVPMGASVLVIDDEPSVRMLAAEVLGDAGFVTLEAADGAQGLRVLQSDVRIDLLITDVGLPGGMNGRQVADAARTLRPGLKVLFITGYAEGAVIGNDRLDAGMHIITKPFAMDALAQRIRDIIALPAAP